MELRADRLASLDAFRGFTIGGMILVNNPGTWAAIYPPLAHAEWHGWTPTDLIFPFFLFIVGVAMAFSLPARASRDSTAGVLARAARRSAVIFALGLLLNAFPRFDLAELRVAGVLQRIAVVYLAAAALYLATSRRTRAWITAALLVGYWALLTLVPVPGVGAPNLTPEGSFAAWLDRLLLPGTMWQGTWDPEGLASTLPAIATALAGIFTGEWLRSGRERAEIAVGMFAAGWLAILAGLAWDLAFPINKNLWTSSYVLFTAGAALEGLALCYWLIDVRGRRAWAKPALVLGVNPLALYVLSSLGASTLAATAVGDTSLKGWLFENLFAPWAPPRAASLAFAIAYLALWLAVGWWLWRRRIFIKV